MFSLMVAAVLTGGAPALAAAPAPVKEGRLQLTVQGAVRLALESDQVRIQRLSYQSARLDITSARARFDPTLSSSFNVTDSNRLTTVQTEGARQLNNVDHSASLSIRQQLPTGTQASISVNGGRFSTNNQFATINPSFSSGFRMSLTQPLLRNFGGLSDRAQVVIARHGAEQSRSDLEARISNTIERAVGAYWNGVLASEGLKVKRRSLELAEQTHAKNKRSLELGALAPLEIHRSEADVARRKLDVLNAELDLRRKIDTLRRELGIDLDPGLRQLELVLGETPRAGEAEAIDAEAAVARATRSRPELVSLAHQLEADDLGVSVARSATRMGLDLVASYALSGTAGNEWDTDTTPPALVARTGLGTAFRQITRRELPVYSLSLNASLPIRNRAANAALARAVIEQQRSRLALEQRRQEIALEVRAAVDQLATDRQAIDLAAAARDFSRQTLESEQRKYELGAADLFFVLDAQAGLAQAELSLLNAEVSYQQSLTRYDRVVGRLLDRFAVVVEGP